MQCVTYNGNRTLHQESWGGPSSFFLGGGGPDPADRPPVVAPVVMSHFVQWRRQDLVRGDTKLHDLSHIGLQ